MGTTVTALLRSGSRIGLAHIGDTRAYLVRGGEVFQITRDHTVVQSLLDSGSITPDEASSHPQRFLLLQALDGEHDFAPDLQFHDAVAGTGTCCLRTGCMRASRPRRSAPSWWGSPILIRRLRS